MVIAAIVIAGAAAALTDWLFLAVLFGEARGNYPEVWWPSIRDGETLPAKIWTVLLGFAVTAAVVLQCGPGGGIAHGLTTAALVLIVPAALLLTAFQFVKMDLWVMVAAGLAWAARLALAGLAAGLLT